LIDVFGLEIWVKGEDLTSIMAFGDEAHNRANSHSHATDTRLAAHDCRIERDSRERFHKSIISDAEMKKMPAKTIPEKTSSAAVVGG